MAISTAATSSSGGTGDRFFDWGDAAVAHPFATLTTTFNSIAHKTGRRLDDAVFDRLQDAYLEAWTDMLPAAALRELAGTSRLLGCIDKALAWERSLMGLEDGEMDGHGDAGRRLAGRIRRAAPGADAAPGARRRVDFLTGMHRVARMHHENRRTTVIGPGRGPGPSTEHYTGRA